MKSYTGCKPCRKAQQVSKTSRPPNPPKSRTSSKKARISQNASGIWCCRCEGYNWVCRCRPGRSTCNAGEIPDGICPTCYPLA